MSVEKICGIYCIENMINHKKYVGQSIDIYRRWSQHRQQNFIARDTFLYNSFKKYGLESFNFYIIEECDESLLNEREIYWISYYDSFRHGYNMTIGGSGNNSGERLNKQNILPKNFTSDICNKITEVVPIAKLDSDFNILEVYKSVQDCARKNKIEATNISKVTKQIHKMCCGFIYLKFNDIQGMTKDSIKEYVAFLRNHYNFSSTHSTKDRKVALIDDCGIISCVYKNINEAARQLNVDPSSITKSL